MKIKVEPLFPTGSYLNVRIGIEMDIPDDVPPINAINQTWDNIIAIHMKRYPNLYNEDGTAKYEMYKGEDEMKGTHVKDVPKITISDEIMNTLSEIENCTSPEILKTYWLKSKSNLVLSEAYKTKEKKLNGG